MSREPTDEEYCAMMADHELQDINPETGWLVCSCGMFTEPCEGEPHDEYSAAYADLKEAYVAEIIRRFAAFQTSGEYVSIQAAIARVHYGRFLNGESFHYLETLLASLRNTPDDEGTATEFLKATHNNFDLAMMLGVHLNAAEQRILQYVLESDVPDAKFEWGASPELNDDNLDTARAIAQVLVRIEKLETRKNPSKHWLGDSLYAISKPLERRKDMIGVVAALYSSRGVTEASTEHILDLLNDESVPVGTLMDGLL